MYIEEDGVTLERKLFC